MIYRIFVINPGSTSTKLAYFENENKIFETNVFHDAPELAKFPDINSQLPYRKQVILDFIKENHIDLTGIDAIVGRGGGTDPCHSGVYEITDKLLADTINSTSGVRHPSNLGPQLAMEMHNIYGGKAYIVDSPMTDEFSDLAHVSGFSDMVRHSHLHALNQKATARRYCRDHGLNYHDCNLIVCHIDGGMSITAHDHGKMIDSSDAAGGEGPFTPTRAGGVDALDLLDAIIKQVQEADQKRETDRADTDRTNTARTNTGDANSDLLAILTGLRKKYTSEGGLASYFGTSNADTIHEIVEKGDEKAALIWDAMIYQICKQIGSMATVLSGKVDAIVCGGGLLRFQDIEDGIRKRCEWIAPVAFYPGEFEHEAMAAGALRVLKGEEELQIYDPKR